MSNFSQEWFCLWELKSLNHCKHLLFLNSQESEFFTFLASLVNLSIEI